jgi:ribosome-binding protein aMBF1 (putative translation factor)
MTDETLSDAVAARVREARRRRNWLTDDLAARCAELGHPELTRAVLENIESGRRDKDGRRRRYVTVEELRVLADALGFSPADVLGGAPAATADGMTAAQLDQMADAFHAAAQHIRSQEES